MNITCILDIKKSLTINKMAWSFHKNFHLLIVVNMLVLYVISVLIGTIMLTSIMIVIIVFLFMRIMLVLQLVLFIIGIVVLIVLMLHEFMLESILINLMYSQWMSSSNSCRDLWEKYYSSRRYFWYEIFENFVYILSLFFF